MMGMMFWMGLLWVALAGCAVWFAVSIAGRRGRGDALEVLRDRLARGEIDVAEFERRQGALSRGGRGPAAAWIVAGAAAVVLFVIVPVVVMAASDWDMPDMWNMHGRGRDTSSSTLVQGGSSATVYIDDFAFVPGNLQVTVGARVTWTNEDSAPHDATARGADWRTRRLSEDDSDTLTFDTPGEYDYECSIHPSMRARLLVR
jgi:plastocyanin